jgi:hypothetical protein
MGDNDVHPEITTFITDTALFHAELDPHGGQHIATAAGEVLRTKIFGRFGELSADDRTFYRTFVNVVKDNFAIDFGAAIAVSDPTHIRVNLNKVDKNDKTSKVLFGETLPPVPSSVEKIWFKDGSVVTKEQWVSQGKTWERFLKDLYDATYRDASVQKWWSS